MSTRLFNIILIKFLLAASTLFCYTNVTAAEVYTRLASGDTLILLDVREVSEYWNGHIAEPFGQLPITPVNLPWSSNVLQNHYNHLPLNVDIIVYCQSGGRSAAASTFLEAHGFTKIFNMLGGFSSWIYETRDGGYGDHSGKWISVNDPFPVEIICTGSGDTSRIIFPPLAVPTPDSIYVELHFASDKIYLPPNVPQSDMKGLFRVTVLDCFGLSLFNTDSIALADTADLIFIPDFHSNIIFYPALKVFVQFEGWRMVESNFNIPAFYRFESILRRWYNGEGWFTTEVAIHTNVPDKFELRVFPNPFNSTLQIISPEEAELFIYDITGRLVEQLKSNIWTPNNLTSSGIYLIRAQYKNHLINKGIVYLK